ncbi:MAG: C4-dicarboxylate transporter DctM subunit [bacterium]|jgi:tripartite ATP-independent transporter DctM subunit
MTTLTIGFILIAVLIALVLLGMQIAYALFAVAFAGIWIIRDNMDLAFKMLELTAYSGIADYLFATIPLFVLMGLLVSVSNVGRDTFEVAEELLRRVVCGLGVATVAANTIFAAVTGVSIASAAVFTRVAVPEMTRHGYRPAFSAGTVAGSSVLGMLIPPSLLLIIYGILAEVSIGGMFLAGIVPGLMLAGGFVAMLICVTLLFPSFVLTDPEASKARRLEVRVERMPLRTMSAKIFPIISLVVLVLGGLYTGYFTPTEAGGIGAFGALIVAIARRSLNRQKLWDVMKQTGVISVSILLLLIAASFYSRML